MPGEPLLEPTIHQLDGGAVPMESGWIDLQAAQPRRGSFVRVCYTVPGSDWRVRRSAEGDGFVTSDAPLLVLNVWMRHSNPKDPNFMLHLLGQDGTSCFVTSTTFWRPAEQIGPASSTTSRADASWTQKLFQVPRSVLDRLNRAFSV